MPGASARVLVALIAAGAALCAAEADSTVRARGLSLTRAGLLGGAQYSAVEQRAAAAGRASAVVALGLPRLVGRGELALLRLRGGAKSKNHTNHNQNRKAHRNGIKRVKLHRHSSSKNIDLKVWRNQRYARKGSMRVHLKDLKAKKLAAKKSVESESAGEASSGAREAEEEGEL